MGIEKVLICGLGALGLTYANKFKEVCELKILANAERVERYKNNPPKLNGRTVELEYILPSEHTTADFILISTKASGLEDAISYIKNFVGKDTIIISLLNGISSEEKIASVYGKDKVLRSYYIGPSAMRNEKGVTLKGCGKIVCEYNPELETFFNKADVCYEISDNIVYAQWIKLGVNIILNEPSALLGLTVGELRQHEGYQELAHNLLTEIKQCHNIGDMKHYEQDVLNSAALVSDNSQTSMLQDMLAKRKTEVDIFSGEIIRLGKIYNIETPYNSMMYRQIKEKEVKILQ